MNKSLISDASCGAATRVLITGVNGMIGSHLARVLVEKPCHHVFGLVRPHSNLDSLVGVLDLLTLLTGDITDGPRMKQLLKETRPDYIYHMAAQAINGISYDNAELTIDTNIRGTFHLLDGVRELENHPRILLAGSSTEYGKTADIWTTPLTEEAPLVPVTPYGVSKLATENLGRQYFLSYGIPIIIARLFIQVGVGGTDSLAIHQFCKQIAMAELGLTDPVIKHGNIESRRDMTDARDSVSAIIELAKVGLPGEAYNVASGKSHSIKELLNIATGLASVPVETQVDPDRYRKYDEKNLVADISKLKAVTGWNPKFNLEDSVHTILDYWRRKIKYLYGL